MVNDRHPAPPHPIRSMVVIIRMLQQPVSPSSGAGRVCLCVGECACLWFHIDIYVYGPGSPENCQPPTIRVHAKTQQQHVAIFEHKFHFQNI